MRELFEVNQVVMLCCYLCLYETYNLLFANPCS